MDRPQFALIYFIYGLAFFTMGFIVALEGGRAADERLRHALRPLAAFGILHGLHEWMELFEALGLLPPPALGLEAWLGLRLAILAFSFLSLGAFGASLLSPTERQRRLSLMIPLAQVTIWGLGLFWLRPRLGWQTTMWEAASVWTRYLLAIPGALLAAAGLVAQQRAFRRAGLTSFSRDSLWAAVAFAWYGLIGQTFTHHSVLWPSTFVNEDLFIRLFGFPVQVLRATAATAAALFVIRFLRAFEVEAQRHIADLQAARVQEAERRDALRGELLRRVVAAQEAERQRVARDLHDATGQSLTALGLGLRGVATSLTGDGVAASAAAAKLRQLEGLASSALDELRRLIADLRPSHLDDLGLPATLRWYAKEVQQRTSLEVQVEIEGEPRFTRPPVRIALFRVAQEALTNVIKHSGATRAQVQLSFAENGVRLQVSDNGRGFDPVQGQLLPTQASRPAWGLLGMQERAELLGGQFEIQTRPGQGTRVSVMIPYEATEVEA